MRLVVTFDDEHIKARDAQGRPPVFGIWWQHEDIYYPSKQWIDFGTVVLGWWLVAVKKVLEGGRKQTLRFMDGPYRLTIERLRNGRELHCYDDQHAFACDVSPEDLVRILRTTSATVLRTLGRLRVAESERQSLSKGLALLPAAPPGSNREPVRPSGIARTPRRTASQDGRSHALRGNKKKP